MHTGFELLRDNAKVILRCIYKIDIIGGEFTAECIYHSDQVDFWA